MKYASTIATVLCLGALAGAVACSGDDTSSSSSSSSSGSPGTAGDGGEPGGPGGVTTFAGYVKDLVVNHSGDAVPQTNDQIAAAPMDAADPIAESMTSFDTAFFAGH